MVETEMSIRPNSSYSKIETNENYQIDPKDIKLGIYTKDLLEDEQNNISNSEGSLLPISIEQSQTFFYKRIGNTFAFFGDIYGDPKIIIGPHWPLYFVVTGFFTTGLYLILKNFGNYINFFLKLLGIIIYLTFFISYSYTAFINPGYPKHDIDALTGEPRKKFYFCDICKLWANKEKNTRHCNDCDICVEGNDHHCPWTGKCIGAKNYKSFITFVISIFVLFGYAILVVSLMDRNALINAKKKQPSH